MMFAVTFTLVNMENVNVLTNIVHRKSYIGFVSRL